jgi:hypothetical protein
MVEQRTENPRVPSSILGLGTTFFIERLWWPAIYTITIDAMTLRVILALYQNQAIQCFSVCPSFELR